MFKDPLAMHSIASICPIIYNVSNQENPLTPINGRINED